MPNLGRTGSQRIGAETVLETEKPRIKAIVSGLTGETFETRFNEARKAVVEQQREALKTGFRPSAGILEEVTKSVKGFLDLNEEGLGNLSDAEPVAASMSTALSTQRERKDLFVENLDSIGSIAKSAFGESLGFLQQQLRIVKDSGPFRPAERSSVAAAIDKKIEQSIKGKALGDHYGVLDATITARSSAQTKLRKERFKNISQPNCTPKLSVQHLKPLVNDERLGRTLAEVPVEYETHEQDLSKELQPLLASRLIEQHAASVDSQELRLAFEERLRRALDEENSAGKLLRDRVKTCLEPRLKALRSKLAEKELSTEFPKIADLSYTFSNEAMAELQLVDEKAVSRSFPLTRG